MKRESLEGLIRRAANRIGIDIQRYRPRSTELARLAAMLATHNVDFVIDVGANEGQFAKGLRAAGYPGHILSFEPLPEPHARLERASAADGGWDIAQRVALGDHNGEVEIHVSANSVSSSVLQMLASHLNAAPDSRSVGVERVHLSTLDAMMRGHSALGLAPFLKIDTQGYEDQVLSGASELVSRLVGVHLELSLVPLYEGQALYDAMLSRLQREGFAIWAIWPGICDPESGRMLQVDATLFRA